MTVQLHWCLYTRVFGFFSTKSWKFLGLLSLVSSIAAADAPPIAWSVKTTSSSPGELGKTIQLRLSASIQAGWHLYALKEPEGGPIATTISLASPGFKLGSIVALAEEAKKTELLGWAAWADLQADRLDPLKEPPPSIVDDKQEVLRRIRAVEWGW
jgi:hypothetical protein